MSLGIVNVLTDPRTNVDQCLNALLTVELTDNAAWELLIELAQAAGHPNIADSFTKAKTQEDDHLVKIKTLMRRGADPHSYEPTLHNTRDIAYADAVFTNGLLLEPQALTRTIDATARPQARVVALAEQTQRFG